MQFLVSSYIYIAHDVLKLYHIETFFIHFFLKIKTRNLESLNLEKI